MPSSHLIQPSTTKPHIKEAAVPVGDELEALEMPPVEGSHEAAAAVVVSADPHSEGISAFQHGRSWDPLRKYMQEATVAPLLTSEEEHALALRVRQGDPEARERMILSNLRFVISLAKKYFGYGLPALDVINLGNIGLMIAVDRFDPDRGAKFSTCAVWWIRQRILIGISNQARIIRLPVHLIRELNHLKRTKEELEGVLGHEPTEDEVAEKAKMPATKVHRVLATPVSSASFDAPIGSERKQTVGETLADDQAEDPRLVAERNDLKSRLKGWLRGLDKRDQAIITRRFGLDGREPETLESIGADFSVTRERVRQLEARALDKLRIVADT